MLDTAFATPQKRLDEKSGSIYGSISEELKSNFNRAVAEIELALQESEDEIDVFREVWREYLNQYPGKLNALELEMSGEKPVYEEKSETYGPATLKLLSVPSDINTKIKVAQVIRAGTSMSLSAAKKAVDRAPSVLGTDFESDVARALENQLRSLGAEVEII